MKKDYLKRLDLIRVVSCIAVLFYHLGLLKGGYLAVCTFFVLTGYLSIVTTSRKAEFSLKKYYISKLKRVYLPLIIVVFTTIAIISLMPGINYINLKPETTSVLLGYNNFWQLNANLDYFVRHISSPFIHLWYIAILLQYELIFPIIYMLFVGKKKKRRSLKKMIPIILCTILGIGSCILFYLEVKKGSLMPAYYGTLTRAFSILFGISLGLIHVNYKPLVLKKLSSVFYLYLIALIALCVFIDFKSPLFSMSMIITSLITMKLIDYSTLSSENKTVFDKIIHSLSSVSYEIYLIQYPVIFLFQDIAIDKTLKLIAIILITLVLSYIIHFALNIKKKSKLKVLRVLLIIILSLISMFGIYKYIIAKDYTNDIKRLEQELSNNQELIEKKRKEYAAKKKDEEDKYQKELEELTPNKENIEKYVRNLKVTGIGDSIMELCIKELYEEFPNGYFDAKVNRTEAVANEILKDLVSKNMLGDVVVFNLGTNGNGLSTYRDEILKTIGNRKIFWLNATRPDVKIYNPNLIDYAKKHDNVYIIDWVSVANAHPEYIVYDGVHPSVRGRKPYAKTIFDGIYKVYEKELNAKKEKKIKEHEEQEKKKITFVGNDLLVGLYDYLKDDYSDSDFIIDKKLTYKELKNQLESKIKNKELNHNVVLVFNNKLSISKTEYMELIKLCKDYKVYIIDTSENLNINEKNTTIIKFNEKDYLSVDNIHLSEKGNKKLKEIIDSKLKKE